MKKYFEWCEAKNKKHVDLSALMGKIVTNILINDEHDVILFVCSDDEVYKMYHEQDCCESVGIEDISGNLEDLLNTPITMAEEESNSSETEWGSCTWTYYKLATVKGYVTLRWCGESNGYYSESVDVIQVQ